VNIAFIVCAADTNIGSGVHVIAAARTLRSMLRRKIRNLGNCYSIMMHGE